MKKSPHQIIVDMLQKQLLVDPPCQGCASKINSRVSNKDACTKDIMKKF